MESSQVCEPCIAQEKSSVAVKLCSDCEEKLCTNCVEDHSKFKAFRSHHLIDLSAFGSKIPSLAKHCDFHEDSLLDFFCSQHGVACCRSCIPINHQTCKDVLPIEVASRNIKDSKVLQDAFGDTDNVLKTLTYLMENRNKNIKKLQECETVIVTQLQKVKEQIMKQVDQQEGKIASDLSCMKQRHESKLNEEKTEIMRLTNQVLKGKEQIEFLREHGSNTHLFLAVICHENNVQAVESNIEKMTMTFTDTELTFNSANDLKIESIGSVTEKSRSCQIKHKSIKLKQAQANTESIKPITNIKWERKLHLKIVEDYNLTGIAVTNDNNLLLCNFWSKQPYVYMYSNCDQYETQFAFSSRPFGVAILPKDDMAVVTFPDEKNLQYVNTKIYTKCNTIQTAEACYGVCASRNNILLGGVGTIYLLNLEGSLISKVETQHKVKFCSIGFNDKNQQIICRGKETLLSLKLTGDVVYTHKVKGEAGLTLDRDGNVYFNDEQEVYRLSSNGNCEDMIMQSSKVKNPYTIAFNKDYTRLFVICGCRYVHICGCY
ncbi:E3 ubiquitin-protein ligase TRIM71-like [Mytilus trossulus]|uniref:E3 ubiquitin-protein ligase TRIM71-like n=1 Tax=Mytilus trossulus TaxID=6551 RepID=UPI003006E8EF